MRKVQVLTEVDIPALTELLSRTVKTVRITNDVAREKTLGAFDYVRDLCIGFFFGEDLIGSAAGCVSPLKNRGGVRFLVVDPRYRRQGIGTELLNILEQRLQASAQILEITMMALPGNYLTPGVEPFDIESTCFLEKRGYSVVGHSQTLVAYANGQRPYRSELDAALSMGYHFSRPSSDIERAQVIAFVEQQFPYWSEELRRALLNYPVTVQVCTANQELVSFACAEANNVGTGTHGPVGVHPLHRNKGIATVMMHLCMDDLRNLGYEQFYLPWPRMDWSRCFRREFRAERHAIYWLYNKKVALPE